MSTQAPGTGIVVGPPQPRRGTPGASWSFSAPGLDMSSLSPMFNALMTRYGQAMDYQLEDMASMPGRNETAFLDWTHKRAQENKERELAMTNEQEDRRRATLAQDMAARAAAEAQMKAEADKRAALLATVAQAREQHSVMGGAQPFDPSSAIADYYAYGGQR